MNGGLTENVVSLMKRERRVKEQSENTGEGGGDDGESPRAGVGAIERENAP